MTRNKTKQVNREVVIDKKINADNEEKKQIEAEYADMMADLSAEEENNNTVEDTVVTEDKTDAITEIVDEEISDEEDGNKVIEDTVAEEAEANKQTNEEEQKAEETVSNDTEEVVEQKEEEAKVENTEAKKEEKKPKRRMTTREMFGCDWLGLNYDF